MKKLFLLIVCLTITLSTFAQETYPVNGVYDEREDAYAFTNATIYTHFNQKIEKATLVIRDGRIEGVGVGITIPKDATVIDLKGKYVYPSFIDLYTSYGLPELKKSDRKWSDPPVFVSDKKGAYAWNKTIHPEFSAYQNFSVNNETAKALKEAGFGAVLTHQKDGIARGSGTFVLLSDEMDNEVILKDEASAHYSFKKGNSPQGYPSSLMGAIALLRQTYLDADWYNTTKDKKEFNISLAAWNQLQSLPQIFEVRDRLDILRADKIGDEFDVQYIIKGKGDEYMRVDAIKQTNASFIVPVTFPKAYDVEDPFDAMIVSMEDLKHWELAPANPAILAENDINFTFTTDGLKDLKAFHKNLVKAVERGLKEEAALKALIHTPATLLDVQNHLGSLERGKIANFIITSGNYFDKKTKIHENWIHGQQLFISDWDHDDFGGSYTLQVADIDYQLDIEGEPGKPKMNIVLNDSTKIKVNGQLKDQSVALHFNAAKDSNRVDKLGKGVIRLGGWMQEDGKKWQGKGQLANGEWVDWMVNYKGEVKKKEEEKDKDKAKGKGKKNKKKKADKDKSADNNKEEEKYGQVTYPFLAYGWTEKPKAGTVLFQNATVWTNESDGILEETDVLIQDGKIAAIGAGLKADKGVKVVDATGKHLTSGIIDEHSHIAISRGVNEGTQASSAEVSIADVINSEDVNIYRQLAGGVTAAQLLHGSANPIGGQSGIIKFRWGLTPEEMKFKEAAPFIKFALGENVKQSNWGDNNTTRFPQTRMGVEQVYMDHFTRAKEYEKQKADAAKSGTSFRKDLELETLLQIINKERFITCHSYVQSEITMLMRVAEKFGFNINTFTHILEGYKIADKMEKHGVAGSTFSDWWAYKYEVIDAIPHNGTILHEMGVLTSFNSDDAEMGRRLNQEAAKAVKYGGLSEEEAWKFVTLNPAKMLHVDEHVGSIKVGKQADVVLWSDHPMSIYTKAEQTYVDGVCYFDMEQDLKMRTALNEERNRLIQKMLEEKQGGGDTQKPMPKPSHHYHCDDMHPYE